jgi:hypothetical protein
VVSG